MPLEIVHCDVSPQSILLSFDGAVEIVDFGIASARWFDEEAGLLKAKFDYMSPEHACGEKVDRRRDLYALGVILWEMLTGRALHGGLADEEIEAESLVSELARGLGDVQAALDACDRAPAASSPAVDSTASVRARGGGGEETRACGACSASARSSRHWRERYRPTRARPSLLLVARGRHLAKHCHCGLLVPRW